jgi:hypothetical protein
MNCQIVSSEFTSGSDASGVLHITEMEINDVSEATNHSAGHSSYILPTVTLHRDKLSNK